MIYTLQPVQWFLMASFIYYKCPDSHSIMTDSEFDDLCKYLVHNWDGIEHRHKYLISLDALKAGTGYHIQEYPLIVQNAAIRQTSEFMNKNRKRKK